MNLTYIDIFVNTIVLSCLFNNRIPKTMLIFEKINKLLVTKLLQTKNPRFFMERTYYNFFLFNIQCVIEKG